ncbi:hypothetical protein ACOJVU_07615 [Mycobacterium sp. THU-M104]|uniref:PE family protein n=1 Tax=Mycobacterium intracellulare subsp. chimaera TaxID=222805 RepID=A0ABT7P2C7_MYCIT|nr:hypothetical protein [Mycobacterium intracellulare]MDM3927433.1 hypothetical protein [Mycobacterium intracellulare subsp. chimaera]
MSERVIRLEAEELASATGGWLAAAPIQPSIHPICTPGTDPMSMAVSAVAADWPAVHEALTANRATQVGELAAANGGTEANLSAAEATNVEQITGIEV